MGISGLSQYIPSSIKDHSPQIWKVAKNKYVLGLALVLAVVYVAKCILKSNVTVTRTTKTVTRKIKEGGKLQKFPALPITPPKKTLAEKEEEVINKIPDFSKLGTLLENLSKENIAEAIEQCKETKLCIQIQRSADPNVVILLKAHVGLCDLTEQYLHLSHKLFLPDWRFSYKSFQEDFRALVESNFPSNPEAALYESRRTCLDRLIKDLQSHAILASETEWLLYAAGLCQQTLEKIPNTHIWSANEYTKLSKEVDLWEERLSAWLGSNPEDAKAKELQAFAGQARQRLDDKIVAYFTDKLQHLRTICGCLKIDYGVASLFQLKLLLGHWRLFDLEAQHLSLTGYPPQEAWVGHIGAEIIKIETSAANMVAGLTNSLLIEERPQFPAEWNILSSIDGAAEALRAQAWKKPSQELYTLLSTIFEFTNNPGVSEKYPLLRGLLDEHISICRQESLCIEMTRPHWTYSFAEILEMKNKIPVFEAELEEAARNASSDFLKQRVTSIRYIVQALKLEFLPPEESLHSEGQWLLYIVPQCLASLKFPNDIDAYKLLFSQVVELENMLSNWVQDPNHAIELKSVSGAPLKTYQGEAQKRLGEIMRDEFQIGALSGYEIVPERVIEDWVAFDKQVKKIEDQLSRYVGKEHSAQEEDCLSALKIEIQTAKTERNSKVCQILSEQLDVIENQVKGIENSCNDLEKIAEINKACTDLYGRLCQAHRTLPSGVLNHIQRLETITAEWRSFANQQETNIRLQSNSAQAALWKIKNKMEYARLWPPKESQEPVIFDVDSFLKKYPLASPQLKEEALNLKNGSLQKPTHS